MPRPPALHEAHAAPLRLARRAAAKAMAWPRDTPSAPSPPIPARGGAQGAGWASLLLPSGQWQQGGAPRCPTSTRSSPSTTTGCSCRQLGRGAPGPGQAWAGLRQAPQPACSSAGSLGGLGSGRQAPPVAPPLLSGSCRHSTSTPLHPPLPQGCDPPPSAAPAAPASGRSSGQADGRSGGSSLQQNGP